MKRFRLYILLVFLYSCQQEVIQKEISLDNPSYDKAFEYLEQGKADSTFYYFNAAKQVFLENGDSLRVAKCLINMAITQQEQGDYFGAQETALQAVPFLNEHKKEDQDLLSMNFNALGMATDDLKDYPKAILFYELAIKYSDNPQNTLIYRNNLALSYLSDKKYQKARKIYDDIIDEAHKTPVEYARVLSNLARVKWKQDQNYPAIYEFQKALKIREKENDLRGQNSSLAHITEYYENSKPDSALIFAKKRYDIAKKIGSSSDEILALKKLIKLSSSDAAKQLFERYNALNDSIQQARLAATNQFTLIRYEVEKNKAANLSLQKDNAEKAYNISQQRIWIVVVSLLCVVVIIGGIFWYRRRKERLQFEAQSSIKANQLNTSRKIHDVVANGLYRVMTEIENREDIDREGILDRLEMMYEKSRDISYETEVIPQTEQDYHQQVAELLKSFVTEKRKVIIAGNDPEQWNRIRSYAKQEIHHVLQELMINMRKHSQAANVVLRFDWKEDILHIYYSDNGVGMPESQVKGNGLTSTGNRISNMGGKINFASLAGKGLKVEVSIPIF